MEGGYDPISTAEAAFTNIDEYGNTESYANENGDTNAVIRYMLLRYTNWEASKVVTFVLEISRLSSPRPTISTVSHFVSHVM